MRVDLQQAISLLKSGQVVAIPTETVYGLAADASNDAALRQIYAIKQRPMDNPLIVHLASADQVHNWVTAFPPLAQKLAKAFWPGPFTLVLTAKNSVSPIVRGGQPTVALRVPAHPMALDLLQKTGLALAAPSANKFTQLSPTTAAHVTSSLGDSVPVLDGGACKVGIESTIVYVNGDDWQLLRLGMISELKITKIAGKPALKTQHLPKTILKESIKVPGQYLLHYSPKTPIKLFTSRAVLNAYAKTSKSSCVALLFGEVEQKENLPICRYEHFPHLVEQAAMRLYSQLHELDALNVAQLLIELPPKTPEWLAILDRLTRAGHGE
jgi:L-threonylcarbamoyladenylate synthase